MGKVYFTSDLHFGHELLTNALRGMTSKESDELIIHNWNEIVTKRDVVYILGDITMEKRSNLPVLGKLKGMKVVVGGNHDVKKCCSTLKDMGITTMGVLRYKDFICTHIPIHPLFLKECRGNIHGHIHVPDSSHNYNMTLPPGSERYYNVNVEFHEYKPVSFDEILSYFDGLEDGSFTSQLVKFRERLGLKDWNTGNCYWAATLLKNRFGGELYYDVVVGHFVVGFDDGKFYDFGGEYIPAESKNMVAWGKFEDYDPLRYERIKRDCIMNW